MECPICLEVIDTNSYSTPCKHIFHKKCYENFIEFNKWKNIVACPLCNSDIIIEIQNNEVIESKPYYGYCMLTLMIIIFGNIAIYYFTIKLDKRN